MTIQSNTQLHAVAKTVPTAMWMMKILYKEVGKSVAAACQWKLRSRQLQGPTSPRKPQKTKQNI